jgi:hypothetical protein
LNGGGSASPSLGRLSDNAAPPGPAPLPIPLCDLIVTPPSARIDNADTQE